MMQPNLAPGSPGNGQTKGGTDLIIDRASIWFLSATDLGCLIEDGEAAREFLGVRGRPGWITATREALRKAEHPGFTAPMVDESSYALTDRHGRRTFSNYFAAAFMPMVLKLDKPRVHRAGSLTWSMDEIRIGAAGALSIRAYARLVGEPSTVDELVSSFHRLRHELDAERAALVGQFGDIWKDTFPAYPIGPQYQERLRQETYYYEIIDFDMLIGGERMAPKELYASGPINALRQLSGLTRMSLVWQNYDEMSVRRMGQFDLGSRADECWIANEERLVRSHPEQNSNPYVAAFFEDVKLGVELVLQQAACLNYLATWLRSNRWRLLDGLLAEDHHPEAPKSVRKMISELAGASDLFSDRVRVEDNSGHSFFRRLLRRTADLFQLDDRRASGRATFSDLFALADAAATQIVNETSTAVQQLSVNVAENSRRLTRNALIIAIAAALLTGIQLFVTLRNPGPPVLHCSGSSTASPTTVSIPDMVPPIAPSTPTAAPRVSAAPTSPRVNPPTFSVDCVQLGK